jgi:hypothetical protein
VLPAWLPWTLLALLVIAVVSAVWLVVRSGRGVDSARQEKSRARAAVDAAIAALDAPADPRSAIIAAYAAMERAFAAAGVPRSDPEAPREYLRRVLAAASATRREATTLTGLFEEARFSTHPMSERLREVAQSELASLRARLAVNSAR